LAALNGYDRVNRQYSSIENGKSGVDSDEAQHGRKSPKMVRLDRKQAGGRERSSGNRSGDSQSSSKNRQKYSRELDFEYLTTVESNYDKAALDIIIAAYSKHG
jgi:hypothetical protein